MYYFVLLVFILCSLKLLEKEASVEAMQHLEIAIAQFEPLTHSGLFRTNSTFVCGFIMYSYWKLSKNIWTKLFSFYISANMSRHELLALLKGDLITIKPALVMRPEVCRLNETKYTVS